MNIDQKIEKILEILRKRHWSIGVMESCTGGALANAVTNIPGSSDVFNGGLVTYSNEAKIRAGVEEKMIKENGVYSMNVAEDMARKVEGNVGVGVTGNLPGEVFVVIRIGNEVERMKLEVEIEDKDRVKARKGMKVEVVKKTVEMIIDSL